ncbi:hypothetical protein H6761_03440 [Candidatus Nomurabacteria bacterium]|nr:hypothetical protein [Candidatus Nomurabacteria bacterium]
MNKDNKSCCTNHDTYWYHANKIGLLFILLFAICFFWPSFHPAQYGLHLQMMQMTFFGFSGMDWQSFAAGLIQAYFWAYIFVIVWKIVCLSSECSCSCEKTETKKTSKKK